MNKHTTKRAATKFIEQLKTVEATTPQQVTLADLQGRAVETKEGARGIIAGQFIDLPEASAEGHYREALNFNQRLYSDTTKKLEELIKDNLCHLERARDDNERKEILDEINFMKQELDTLHSVAPSYGTSGRINIKNTPAAKILAKLF